MLASWQQQLTMLLPASG